MCATALTQLSFSFGIHSKTSKVYNNHGNSLLIYYLPGRCVDYLQKGADCHYMGFASCGCAPHLTCKHYEPDDGPMTKRLVIMKPGKYLTMIQYLSVGWHIGMNIQMDNTIAITWMGEAPTRGIRNRLNMVYHIY